MGFACGGRDWEGAGKEIEQDGMWFMIIVKLRADCARLGKMSFSSVWIVRGSSVDCCFKGKDVSSMVCYCAALLSLMLAQGCHNFFFWIDEIQIICLSF